MKMKKFISLALVLVFTMVLVVGCGGNKSAKTGTTKTVKVNIGVVEPLTGSMAPLGNDEFNAFKMAVQMINEKGGVDGKYPITYVSADSQSDPAIGASEAERIVTSANPVPVLFGSYSSAIAASISEVAERNKVVLWEMSGSADNLLIKGYKWTFRDESQASAWGNESVEFIMNNDAQVKAKLGKSAKDLKVAIVHEDGPYGTAVAAGNEAAAKKDGLNIVLNEAYSAKSVDLSSTIMKLKASQPDVLLLTSYVNDAILFDRQAKELGFKVPILITHSGGHSEQAFVDGVGADADFIMTVDPVPCNPNLSGFSAKNVALYKEFDKRWTAKYGTHPYHHVEARWFAQTMLFFNNIAPAAIAKSGAFTADSVREALLAANIDAKDSLMGTATQFSSPEKPFTDPWLGQKHVGQNIKATSFINQYFDGQMYCVWPKAFASKDPVLFPPASN
jgi:branched-chain amino acid transport system substrate-binding protein